MKTTLEREVKLDAPAGYVLPEIGGTQLERRIFTSTYFDAAERSLASAGITLRRRVENGAALWQLKLPAGEGRLELEQPGGPVGPPEPLAGLLVAHTRRGRLDRVAELRTIRTGRLIDGLAEVTVDDVSVMDGNRVTDSFTEVELELRAESLDALKPLTRRLRRAGARRGDEQPKVLRVLGPPQAPREEPLQRWFAAQVGEILARDPGTRLDADPEDLHRHRVAVRRLRALLRTDPDLLDAERRERIADELKWLGTELGEVRDLDVMLAHLREQAQTLDGEDGKAATVLLGRLEQARRRARKRLLAALASERYLSLLDELEDAIDHVRGIGRAEVLAIARTEFRKLEKAVRAAPPDASDDQLHALRIRGKRARYAAELAVIAGLSANPFVARAKQLQDVLGEHQDAVVLEERLRALLRPGDPAARAVAVGRLVELERSRRLAARAEWRDAWRKLKRVGNRTWA